MKKTYRVTALLAELRLAVVEAGSVRAWAEANGVSHVYVSDVLNFGAKPGPKILRILGYAKCAPGETLYTKVK